MQQTLQKKNENVMPTTNKISKKHSEKKLKDEN